MTQNSNETEKYEEMDITEDISLTPIFVIAALGLILALSACSDFFLDAEAKGFFACLSILWVYLVCRIVGPPEKRLWNILANIIILPEAMIIGQSIASDHLSIGPSLFGETGNFFLFGSASTLIVLFFIWHAEWEEREKELRKEIKANMAAERERIRSRYAASFYLQSPQTRPGSLPHLPPPRNPSSLKLEEMNPDEDRRLREKEKSELKKFDEKKEDRTWREYIRLSFYFMTLITLMVTLGSTDLFPYAKVAYTLPAIVFFLDVRLISFAIFFVLLLYLAFKEARKWGSIDAPPIPRGTDLTVSPDSSKFARSFLIPVFKLINAVFDFCHTILQVVFSFFYKSFMFLALLGMEAGGILKSMFTLKAWITPSKLVLLFLMAVLAGYLIHYASVFSIGYLQVDSQPWNLMVMEESNAPGLWLLLLIAAYIISMLLALGVARITSEIIEPVDDYSSKGTTAFMLPVISWVIVGFLMTVLALVFPKYEIVGFSPVGTFTAVTLAIILYWGIPRFLSPVWTKEDAEEEGAHDGADQKI